MRLNELSIFLRKRPSLSLLLHLVVLGSLLCWDTASAEDIKKALSLTKEQAEATRSSTLEAAPEQAQLFVDGYLVWIYAQPKRVVTPIGSLRAGQAIAVRKLDTQGKPRVISRKGCRGGWFAVEPEGYVCKDRFISHKPTRYYESMKALLPKAGPYPFDYALSMGSPAYRRIPDLKEAKQMARFYGRARVRSMPRHWRGHEELVSDQELEENSSANNTELGLRLSELPQFIRNGGSVSKEHERRLKRREVPFGSMLALHSAFNTSAGQMLQSADGTIVPRERFRIFKRSIFEGIPLGVAHSLPVAWPKKSLPRYALTQEAKESLKLVKANLSTKGRLRSDRHTLPTTGLISLSTQVKPRTPLHLTGRRIQVDKKEFLELENGDWLQRSGLYLAELKSPSQQIAKDKSKWIHFSIARGTLTSYVGTKPIFTTLASPGIGGRPQKGKTALESRTTPLGTFRINYKYYSDDMSPEVGENRSFWIAEVPFTQYFQQPFAIHVAYWHESFGEPMSGGCINVSPKDGERLFSFTEPRLPEHWYGVSSSKEFGLGTTIVVTADD